MDPHDGEAVHFHRDVLGLTEELSLDGPGGARVTFLQAGRATLEIANLAQTDMIDDLEVGRRVARSCGSHSRSPTPRPSPRT